MRTVRLNDSPEASLSVALASFEGKFTYPLGETSRFRISHGDDYPRFFCAIGNAACFVAMDDGAVVGTIAVALRCLRDPTGQEQQVAYIADLKVLPGPTRGRVLLALLRVARDACLDVTQSAYSVVMNGTASLPSSYTGRLGIPRFTELARVDILHCATEEEFNGEEGAISSPEVGEACFLALSQGRFATLGGSPALRSSMAPSWLVYRNHSACGRLEDTLAAKRLWTVGGDELRSAHLSAFAYRDPDAGAALLRQACRQARSKGFGRLFVAVPDEESDLIQMALGSSSIVKASASVFGFGIGSRAKWSINTAEI